MLYSHLENVPIYIIFGESKEQQDIHFLNVQQVTAEANDGLRVTCTVYMMLLLGDWWGTPVFRQHQNRSEGRSNHASSSGHQRGFRKSEKTAFILRIKVCPEPCWLAKLDHVPTVYFSHGNTLRSLPRILLFLDADFMFQDRLFTSWISTCDMTLSPLSLPHSLRHLIRWSHPPKAEGHQETSGKRMRMETMPTVPEPLNYGHYSAQQTTMTYNEVRCGV